MDLEALCYKLLLVKRTTFGPTSINQFLFCTQFSMQDQGELVSISSDLTNSRGPFGEIAAGGSDNAQDL